MRRTLTARLQNSIGVLNRLTGVLLRRQVNIESISVGYTMGPDISRIAIIIDVESLEEVEQIIKQLNRLIDVLHVHDITNIPHLEHEVVLVKLTTPISKHAEILTVIQLSRASVANVAPKLITIQVIGDADKIEALLRVVKPYGTQSLARTGTTGFSRDLP